jgi:hypothetical protein
MQIAYCSAILSRSREVRHVEIRVLIEERRRTIHWHSSQFSTYRTRQTAATRCSPLSKPLAVKSWALAALHKQSHSYSSCMKLLSSCSITGRENGPVLSWCEAYGRSGKVFRSSCCAVNRSAPCRQAWMPAEFTYTIRGSHAKSLPLKCGICCLQGGHARTSTIRFIAARRECGLHPPAAQLSNRLARHPACRCCRTKVFPVEIPRFQPAVGSMGPRHPFCEATALSCSSIGCC